MSVFLFEANLNKSNKSWILKLNLNTGMRNKIHKYITQLLIEIKNMETVHFYLGPLKSPAKSKAGTNDPQLTGDQGEERLRKDDSSVGSVWKLCSVFEIINFYLFLTKIYPWFQYI